MSEGQEQQAHVQAAAGDRPSRTSGLDRATREQWNADPFHRYLGITLEEQREGYGRLLLHVRPDTPRGAAGSVHGGVIATLIDLVCLAVVASVADHTRERLAGTAELNVSYLRPAFGPVVVAEGRLLKKGRQLAAVDVDISDGRGRLFAKGRCQYALRPQPGTPLD